MWSCAARRLGKGLCPFVGGTRAGYRLDLPFQNVLDVLYNQIDSDWTRIPVCTQREERIIPITTVLFHHSPSLSFTPSPSSTSLRTIIHSSSGDNNIGILLSL